jgi:hypothetical protein
MPQKQRAAIAAFAKAHGYAIVDEFYDAAVSALRATASTASWSKVPTALPAT